MNTPTAAERAAFLLSCISRHTQCNVQPSRWPYECTAKDEHPTDDVFACVDHGAWWHLPKGTGPFGTPTFTSAPYLSLHGE